MDKSSMCGGSHLGRNISFFIGWLESKELLHRFIVAKGALGNKHREMGKDRVAERRPLLKAFVQRVFRSYAISILNARQTEKKRFTAYKGLGGRSYSTFSILDDLHSKLGVSIFVTENAKADVLGIVRQQHPSRQSSYKDAPDSVVPDLSPHELWTRCTRPRGPR
jgi:hypothetical protein